MERYSSYKPTSMQWLKEIPSHWESKKISSLFKERRQKVSDKDFMPLSVSKQGVTPQLETAVKTDNGDNRKLVRSGDFVVNSRSDRKGSCGVSKLDGSVSLINIVLESRGYLNMDYFHYLSRSNSYIEEYYRLGRGIVADLWTTRYSELKNMLIPFPPLAEQERIVSYLEDKTSKIDAYIAEKEKEIDLYKEYIETLIYSNNTGESIIINDWNYCFPESYTMINCRGLFEEISMKGFSDERFLAVTQDKGLIYKDVDGVNFVTAEKKETQKLICSGQFVISLRSFEGGIEYSDKRGLISPAYIVLKLKDKYDNNEMRMFYRFLFKSTPFINRLNTISDSMRDGKSIKFSDIQNYRFPIPSKEVLSTVLRYVKAYDAKSETFTKEVVFLKEYKQRLIADCVTGQVKV